MGRGRLKRTILRLARPHEELIIEQSPEGRERPFQAERTARGKPSGCSMLRVLMDSMEASVAAAE